MHKKYIQETIAVFFIIAATLIVYLQVIDFGLVAIDDQAGYAYFLAHARNNKIHEALFTPPQFSPYWMPTTYATILMDTILFDDSTGMYHLSALFYHIITTLLLFALFKKMTKQLWPSALVATLFAIHPLNVESVAFVAARSTVLSAFMVLLTTAAYFHYTQKPNAFRYLLIVVCFVVGLLARPTIFYLPVLFLLLDYWPLGRIQAKQPSTVTVGYQNDGSAPALTAQTGLSLPQLIIKKIPLFLLAIVGLAGNAYFYKKTDLYHIPFYPKIDGSLVSNLLNAPVSYVGYLCKTVWPSNLAWYLPTKPATFTLWQISSALLLLTLITVAVIKNRRQHPYLAVGWGWFLAAITLPVMINTSHLNFIRDHYAYFPAIGLFVMIAWGGGRIAQTCKRAKPVLIALASILIVTFSILAWRQTTYWKDQFTLYERALTLEPDSTFLHYNFGKTLYDNGRAHQSIKHFKAVLRSQPNSAEALKYLGMAYASTGAARQAEHYYKKALIIQPKSIKTQTQLARLYSSTRQYDKAADIYRQMLTDRPDCAASICYNLACVYARQNNQDEAVFWLKKSVENGFALFEILQQDSDLQNIKETEYYKKITDED